MIFAEDFDEKKVFLAKRNTFCCQSAFFLLFFHYFCCENQSIRLMRKEITFDRFVRILGASLFLVLLYFLLRRLSSVLIPFFVAWIVAYMLYPIVCFFQYKCKLRSRVLSIIATLISILAVLAMVAWLVVPPVIDEFHRLQDIVVNYIKTGSTTSHLPQFIEEYVKPYLDIDKLCDYLTFDDIRDFLNERVPQLLSFVSGSLNALVGFIASLVAILYLFFILLDYEKMSSGFINFVPKKHRKFVEGMIHDVKSGMNAYFRGQSLIALCVGILFSIGFVLIDFPLAIPLGLFIGFLNLVPYLQVVGFVPAIIFALLKAHDTGQNFWGIIALVFLVFVVVQTIQDLYLTPKIMGKAMGLNAAVILLSLSVWGTLLGFVGLIIALPLTTLLISYYKRYVLQGESILDDNENNVELIV